MFPTVVIYTDGACSGNPGYGGWGAVLLAKGYEKNIFGGVKDTTNNRMELMAAVEALKALKYPCKVDLYTDSVYLRNGITLWLSNWKKNGWKTSSGKSVKNQDLWSELEKVSHKHHVHWHWVKGHAGNEYNEKADLLAQQGVQQVKR